MIIGSDRNAVIENIRRSAESGDFFAKVETGDPILTTAESNAIVSGYLRRRTTLSYRLKSMTARSIANIMTYAINRDTEICGLELVRGLEGGAIITSNHFSPVENTGIRHLVHKLGKRRINIVSQETNLAMPGMIGFLMNYADVIPISGNVHYTQREFVDLLRECFEREEYVLIYPEEEMWFNYRKPRPPKPGAYYYAARLGVPIISCFIEQQDMPRMDNDEFRKVRFVVHVLGVIRPRAELSVRENCAAMSAEDYALKKEIYEKVYGKPLDYSFDASDIAGWRGPGADRGTSA